MNNCLNYFVGIDVSKNTLDFSIVLKDTKIFSLQVKNNLRGFNKFIKQAKKYNINLDQALFCCENTGIYSLKLTEFIQKYNYKLWLENPSAILKSQGLVRGKSDLIDSHRIAIYAQRFQDKCKIWYPKNNTLSKMQGLFKLRERILNSINILKKPLQESKNILDKEMQNILEKSCSKSLKSMQEDLKEIEDKLDKLLEEDSEIKDNYDLIKSVPYVGKLSSIYLLLCTNNFDELKTYRKCACYSGIAPFGFSSGTSIKGKTRISHYGNKTLKKLLHMCSLSVLKQKKGNYMLILKGN